MCCVCTEKGCLIWNGLGPFSLYANCGCRLGGGVSPQVFAVMLMTISCYFFLGSLGFMRFRRRGDIGTSSSVARPLTAVRNIPEVAIQQEMGDLCLSLLGGPLSAFAFQVPAPSMLNLKHSLLVFWPFSGNAFGQARADGIFIRLGARMLPVYILNIL